MSFYNALALSVLIAVTFSPNPVITNSNILAFLPSPGRSHSVPFHPLFRQLASRGHNVTLFSHYPMKTSTALNFTNVVIEANIQVFSRIDFADLRKYTRFFNWRYIHDELQSYFTQLVRDKQFVDFCDTLNTKFDLVFVELYHLDASFALGQRYDCPVIGLSVQPMLPIYHWLLGSPTTFSYIPHAYLPYTDVMTLWQRSVNAFFGLFTVLYYNFVSVPAYQKNVDFVATRTGERAASVQELTRNLSLAFVESHFSCSFVRPNPPNVIDVAGIHMEEPKPLPQDIQRFMDEAEHGVIYVSLGSLVNPQLAVELGSKLLKIFKTLPQRVIWKWKVDSAESVSGNLMVRDWLPQFDILNHPKCRLFISHGGYHSIMETVYSGVPILGLPFFTDQHHNMAFVLKKNIGKKIDPDSRGTELREAIYELLRDDTEGVVDYVVALLADTSCSSDDICLHEVSTAISLEPAGTFFEGLFIQVHKPLQRYRQRCEKQSLLFKDRPVQPMDTAVFWTEHVLQHKGADHLKTAAQDLYWYEYLLLDVILIPTLAVGALVFAIIIILKKLTNALKCVLVKDSSMPERKKKFD